MNVLLVGGGGREHALAWKLAQSPRLTRLVAAPGNPGIARHAECVAVSVDDHAGLLRLADKARPDLIVIGPEMPLVAGLADRFRDAGFSVFGPRARAAAIEGSKAFSKALMKRHGVATARFETFDDAGRARRFACDLGAPLVVKTDGLAAGKGAIVCATLAEADDAIAACLERREFGAAGARVIVEEFLVGEEVSFFALVSGRQATPLAAAQDHKAVFDGDRGPNTGGMGAFSPVASFDAAMQARAMNTLVHPTIGALADEGAPFSGVLFVQLMLTAGGPKIVEFNCRFGDPECQAILAPMEADLLPMLAAVAGGAVPAAVPTPRRAAVCVTLASGGYPGRYATGIPITGIDDAEAVAGVQVFQAGTARRDGRLVTAGGRVLGVTAVGDDMANAIDTAYESVARIRFEGMHFRRDIGRRRAVAV
ncbi:MAG TPA: phosphoribosylamine--glycine ligase [Methylomirabilota bacterium]|nr:phosphoribosylamine--glycine ligase [Methylomirabilota bacterium]